MRTKRRFSLEQKRRVVEEALSGAFSLAQVCQRHEVAAGQVHQWRRQYEQGLFSAEAREVRELNDRIRQLERKVGQMAVENDFLKTALRRAGSRPIRSVPWSGGMSGSASPNGAD